jgi:N-acetylglucosamine-6-sulfatase
MVRLRTLGEIDNTLVVFASDNGYLWGEHGLFDKSAPYLPSVEIPLVIRWPGHIAEGATDDRLAGLLDLVPTIYDAAGVEPTHPLGIDLLRPTARRSVLLLEFWRLPHYFIPSWKAFVAPDSEFIRYGPDGVRFEEYYDLRRDPQQLVNLLHDGSTRDDPNVSHLESLLRRFATCSGKSCPR